MTLIRGTWHKSFISQFFGNVDRCVRSCSSSSVFMKMRMKRKFIGILRRRDDVKMLPCGKFQLIKVTYTGCCRWAGAVPKKRLIVPGQPTTTHWPPIIQLTGGAAPRPNRSFPHIGILTALRCPTLRPCVAPADHQSVSRGSQSVIYIVQLHEIVSPEVQYILMIYG